MDKEVLCGNATQSNSGRFRYIHAYSGILRHIQELFRCIHSGIFQTLCNHGISPWCNPGIFRTLAYSEQES